VSIIKQLLEMKLKTSTSFRALALNFLIQINNMKLDLNAPTHTTILNWVHKVGYYQLKKPKEKADDWIIIIDESIQIGQNKIMMIFGIREKDIDFTRPLKIHDMIPLRELVKKSWPYEQIKKLLLDLKKELGNIKYAISDGGYNLLKGIEVAELPHVYDLTHKIAWIIKKIFKDNENYKSLTGKMSEMRVKYLQTEIAFLIPPKKREKARFMNINKISKWCLKILNYCESIKYIKNEIFEKISWILDYKDFILELSEISVLICKIQKILKHNGFSKQTLKECELLLDNINSDSGIKIKEYMNNYFVDLNLMKEEKLLITSDVIESAFGKYKNYISRNPMAGITNLALSISAFTCLLSENEIIKSLENTAIHDVKKWTRENIGETLFKKRRLAFCSN